MERIDKGNKLHKKESRGTLLLSVIELIVLVVLTVSLVLIVDYLIAKYIFESVLNWNFAHTLLGAIVLESIAFIIVGIRFLQEKVEQTLPGVIWDGATLIPVARHPAFLVVWKAKPKLGKVLIGAGIVLFIIGLFILPSYFNL